MKIIFVSFGQFAGTHFYYHLAKALKSTGYEVELVTDASAARRLDEKTALNLLPVVCIPFSPTSIQSYLESKRDQEIFVLFSSVLFALPCTDFLEQIDYSIQSTLFLRYVFIDSISNLINLKANEWLPEITKEKDINTLFSSWQKDLKIICDYIIFPGYAHLYSIYDETPYRALLTSNLLYPTRSDFYRVVGTFPLLISVEKRILQGSKRIYSYYREKHKLDKLNHYYPEFQDKISALIPGIDFSERDIIIDEDALGKKRENRSILFFCGEREFFHWKGELAIAIFSALPKDFNLTILGELPRNYIRQIPEDVLGRIKHGIVNEIDQSRQIYEQSSVLLAINRQLVSYSALESMKYKIPCIFSKQIISYEHGTIDRLETDVGIYVEEDSPESYVEAIQSVLTDSQRYIKCVSTQLSFLKRHYRLQETVQQFEQELL